MSGWICSYRKIWEHPIFKGNAQRVGVWDWMLKTAAWKPTRQNANGVIVDLKRGQLCVSQAQITSATGMPRQQVRTLLKLLENEGAIAPEANHNLTKSRSVITICKYDNYQARPETENQEPTKSQPTKEQGNNITTLEAKASLSAKADAKAEISQAVSDFKEMAERQGWPTIRILSKARQAALKARLRDAGGLDGWREALRRASASDHCNGDNDRGWVCNFDFLTSQAKFTKLMEGNYDNRTSRNSPASNGRRSSPHDSIMAGFAAFADSEPDASGRNFDGHSPADYPGDTSMDCGPGGDTSQPILRIVNPG